MDDGNHDDTDDEVEYEGRSMAGTVLVFDAPVL
jgi:hypothetical protein